MKSFFIRQPKIIENDLDAQVENVIISGSRCRGIEKNGSDLDVVVDSGKMIFLIYCMRMDSPLLEL